MPIDDDPRYVEKRKHQRVHTRIEIPYWKYVKFKNRDEINIGFVKNMSRGGCFIETDVIYEGGGQVGFEFYLPNSSKPVSGMAEVRWVTRVDDPSVLSGSAEAGMGLEFKTFDGEAEQILEEFIKLEVSKQR